MVKLHIITPVKDSVSTALQTIEQVMNSDEKGFKYTVYNDYSTVETKNALIKDAAEKGYSLVHLEDLTNHPSPNYLLVLQHAQQQALKDKCPLLIIESDVLVTKTTISQLLQLTNDLKKPGMIASVTTDAAGNVNFPYLYATRYPSATAATRKRLSFCCTLLTNEFLSSYNFGNLNPEKNWYDVFISRQSIAEGFTNYLAMDIPVVHLPHSSRPWKLEKYTNPLRYYWKKITKRRDKI